MKLILVDQRHGHTRTIVLKGWLKGLLSLCLLGTPVAMGYVGYQLAVPDDDAVFNKETAQNWERQLQRQADELADIKQYSQQQLDALTLRLAMLQARLARLDAVGERITDMADLNDGEFDFTQPVALGGPEFGESRSVTSGELEAAIAQLEYQLEDRRQQLGILESLLLNRRIESDVLVAGTPVERGWVASRFGRRPDPFTGQLSFHSGVDLTTGKAGSDINAVAAGVVTWAGPKSEYGLMVEVNHGNGFVTRYAHAEKLFVDVGEVVKKGQNIALVGSTGRSTAPHVHFEVYKHGRVVDPAAYIHSTAR